MAKKKNEKKNINRQKDKKSQLFSQDQLASMLGLSVYQLDSLYSIRGIDRNKKMGLDEARKLFNNIG